MALIPSAWAEDLSNAQYSDSPLLNAVLSTRLPCVTKRNLHTTAIPERDVRVPKAPAWPASQNTSKTPGSVCGSDTIAPTGRPRRQRPARFEVFEVFCRGTLSTSLVPGSLQRVTSLDGPEAGGSRAS